MFRIPSILGPLSRLTATGDDRARMHDEICRIDNRSYGYGVIEGTGPPVILLHGWGLAHHSYAAAAEAVALQGFRVIVPDLPGFGTSSDLPFLGMSFASYARALRRFLEECLEVAGEPAHLVGHSFGGGVAAQLAHDAPELVKSVVLVSSVSGATWQRAGEAERPLAERPLWDWGVHLLSEFPTRQFPVAQLSLLRDLSHNLVWHLPNLGFAANMIRHSDLRNELSKVRQRNIPVAVIWAKGDHVITKASFDDQCTALGIDGLLVDGNHGWPLSDPARFARTVGELIRTVEPATGATCPS